MKDDGRGFNLAVLFAFLLLAPLAYANVLNSFFLSDDFVVLARLAAGNHSPVYAESQGGLIRVLLPLSALLDLRLWGLNPLGFHLSNVALHALNSFLVYLLALRLRRDDARAHNAQSGVTPASRALDTPAARRLAALAAGLIFLLHPSHTESVTWTTGRVDVQMAFFYLLALLAFSSYAETTLRTRLWLALAAFALALLAKEPAVSFPLAAFVTGLYLARGRGLSGALGRAARLVWPFFALLAAYVAARALVVGSLVGGYGASRHLNFKHSVVVSQLLRSVLRALLPAVVLQSRALESHALSVALLALGFAVALGFAFVLLRARLRRTLFARARRPALLWALAALFLICLLPTINLRVDVYTTQGERYLYLPTAFSSVALALALARARRQRLALAAASCLLVFYAAALWQTNRIWRQASDLSRSIVEDIGGQAGGGASVYVLNAPDTLRGVHLYRNGIAESVALFLPAKQVASVNVLSWHTLLTPLDRVELSADPAGYKLTLADPRATFERVDAAPPCVSLSGRSRNELRLRLEGCPPTVKVFYFGEGRMRALAP
ncbi:MAG TPA: hypothetical protein VM864_00845 [Pyrinomonadaceae bacterium]|jgi:hypothetical protein|nr:hypothetical protein [Pyrinomonadaceae bacterium]